MSKGTYQGKCFSLKTYLKNPTNDLIKFKILTKFYLRGCQTCVPIVRRNVPKKRRFFKMWIFCQPLGHWANYFRSLGENFSPVSLKLHFRCAEAHFEEKQIRWTKERKVITNNCRKSFVHNKKTSEEAVLVFLKGLGCQDICALVASRFFFRILASHGDRIFCSGDLLLFVSTCLYLANTALARTEKIPRRIPEISILHWILTVQI